MITAKELEDRGIDGDEIEYDDNLDPLDVKRNNEETDFNRTNERQDLWDSLKEDAKDLIEAIESGDENKVSYWNRRVNQTTENYLYHESNNFNELIERKI